MKKLFALLLCLGAVSIASVLASAEAATPLKPDPTTGKFASATVSDVTVETTFNKTTEEFTTVVTGADAGSQVTLLAFAGEDLDTDTPGTNIQAIDQNGTATFTYKMRTTLNVAGGDTFTIKVGGGGTSIPTPIAQYVEPIEATSTGDPTYKITGSVTNIAAAASTLATAQYATAQQLTDADAAWATYVALKANVKDSAVLKDKEGKDIIVKVDIASKSFEIPNVAPGTYSLVIYRKGFLPLYMKGITVVDQDVPVGSKELKGGDLFTEAATPFNIYGTFSTNGIVNGGDITVLMGGYNKEIRSPSGYDYSYDIFPDFIINGGDITVLMGSYNKDIYSYGEGITANDFK